MSHPCLNLKKGLSLLHKLLSSLEFYEIVVQYNMSDTILFSALERLKKKTVCEGGKLKISKDFWRQKRHRKRT